MPGQAVALVETPDGPTVAVHEWGEPNGPDGAKG